MEGGYKPWRRQHLCEGAPDLDSFGKPLPPPPIGYYWVRKEDRSWEIIKFDKTVLLDGQQSFDAPVVLEHVVMPEDTLQGLCLRYRVSAMELRRHNNFSGNNISYISTLRIPIDHNLPVTRQLESQDVLIQRFKNVTRETAAEAEYYLKESGWDFNLAMDTWSADASWAQPHEDALNEDPISVVHNHEPPESPGGIPSPNADIELKTISKTPSKNTSDTKKHGKRRGIFSRLTSGSSEGGHFTAPEIIDDAADKETEAEADAETVAKGSRCRARTASSTGSSSSSTSSSTEKKKLFAFGGGFYRSRAASTPPSTPSSSLSPSPSQLSSSPTSPLPVNGKGQQQSTGGRESKSWMSPTKSVFSLFQRSKRAWSVPGAVEPELDPLHESLIEDDISAMENYYSTVVVPPECPIRQLS